MNSDIAFIIPALDKNQYYPDGDMVKFGDTTLLEWKISQVLGVAEKENVFISTPSEKIIALARDYGVHSVKRSESDDPKRWILESVEPVKQKIILWANVTSPFISTEDYEEMIKIFFDLPEENDSLISVYKESEYIYFQNKPLNFDINAYKSRKTLDPIYRVTNGCYITSKESYLQNRKYFGQSPYFHEVDKLKALEIKDIDHYQMATSLLPIYFKIKEI
jgi:CMP-N-acetylneuraminic acid synthetase